MFAEANLRSNSLSRRARQAAVVCLCLASTVLMFSQTLIQTPTQDAQTFATAGSAEEGGQTATASLSGVVNDAKGAALPKANVILRSESNGSIKTTITDATGHFSVDGLKPGSYTVEASAPGFAATSQTVKVSATQPAAVTLGLQVGSTTSDITVEADATGSVAAALAPMDALLTETSPHTEITAAMIQNFMSPVADYGEAVEMAPGTFTTNGNGVGLGQSKTYFRGFPDGDYDIDFDGIPFYDTNTPSHHSWAFFPSQFLGGIDFDRSPGTASTIGPTPFGGSIHLLSRDLSPTQNIRGQFSGGSFHTYLYDLEYDSGSFGPGHKLSTSIDIHHLQSNGYQTYNYQTRNAGAIKLQYKISDHFILTGFSGVIWLDANTPNFNATRCQMYGVSATGAYSCIISGTTLYPYTGAGINFLNANNADPLLYLDYQYNFYHVPTDFEYIGVHKEWAHGVTLDIKPYTYNYDNSEKYSNAVPITDNPALAGTTYAPLAAKVVLCTTPVTKKGVTAIPCGVDKYNSYRKYGETSELDWVTKYGVLKAGMWYEWANTNRHQYPSDPTTNWTDQALPNFAEKFVTNSYQPFVEYRYHVTKHLDVDAGVKLPYYTIGTKQYADDGKTIGGLGTNNPASFISNGGSYFAALPSVVANYRIRNNWSAYGQLAYGSIVPPSSVFDYQQSTTPGQVIPVATLPKQQKSTTYQFGTVLKLKRVTFDADYYHVYFDNSYSSTSNAATGGEPVFFLQPASITKGFEAESNIYLGWGVSAYLNATVGRALYTGNQNATATGSNAATAPTLSVAAPGYLWVQQTPSDTETEGITYQHKAFDFGVFNKRVGTFYIDNGAYHNQAKIDPFTLTNLFFNYTLRTGGRFDNTKFRVSFNNIFDEHNITGDSISGSVSNITLSQTVNGTTYTYTDPFNTNGPTPINGQDNISILPGRSIMFAVTFGFNPSHKR